MKLIGEDTRIRSLIRQHTRNNTSDSLEGELGSLISDILVETLERKLYPVKPVKGKDYFTEDEVVEFLDRITPKKGVHYFDGENGEKGEKGDKGDRGLTGERGPRGETGKDGKGITKSELRTTVEDILSSKKASDFGAITMDELEEIFVSKDKKSKKSLEARLNALQDAVMRNYGGHGGSRPTYYDLSSQLDGVTKTFTIDRHSKIISITSSSAPFTFRPIVDFTDTATTVTFVSSIDAPSMLASGQSIVILLIP